MPLSRTLVLVVLVPAAALLSMGRPAMQLSSPEPVAPAFEIFATVTPLATEPSEHSEQIRPHKYRCDAVVREPGTKRMFGRVRIDAWSGKQVLAARTRGPYRFELHALIDEADRVANTRVVVFQDDAVIASTHSRVAFRSRQEEPRRHYVSHERAGHMND